MKHIKNYIDAFLYKVFILRMSRKYAKPFNQIKWVEMTRKEQSFFMDYVRVSR
jgi:hypothetical protein